MSYIVGLNNLLENLINDNKLNEYQIYDILLDTKNNLNNYLSGFIDFCDKHKCAKCKFNNKLVCDDNCQEIKYTY